MMASTNPSYDYIVIGAGLSGLLTAARLSTHTAKVLLVDESETFGGSHKSYQSAWGPMNASLQFVSNTQGSVEAAHLLENFLGLKLIQGISENSIHTFEKGELKRFLGFGDHAPEFFDEISPFLAAEKMDLHLEWSEIIGLIHQKFTGDFMPKTVVTGFDVQDGKVSGVTLNGSKKVSSENVIYCGNLKRLYPLIQNFKEVSGRVKTKLSKGPYWSVLRLDLFFSKEITQNLSIHLLSGASSDDITPCLGKFWPASEAGQASQWLTYLPSLEAEESELVGEALKKIKRQVKRAFQGAQPEGEGDLQSLIAREKITLFEYQEGGDLKLDGEMCLPGIQGLWIGSSQISSEKGTLSGVLQSEKVLSSLGFQNSFASENSPVLMTNASL